MKTCRYLFSILFLEMITQISFAQNNPNLPMIKEENVTYTSDGKIFTGFIAYPDHVQGKLPGILIIHEWWGLTDYPKNRARQLARMGYIAMAADLFGNGKTAADPKEAQSLTMPFYQDPELAKKRVDAALNELKKNRQTDAGHMAAIGYCFGGFVVLNAAKLGTDVKGVVSFHGGLGGVLPRKEMLKAQILVCHGGSDKFVSQADINTFKHQMDSIHADYTFKVYPDATHAFTNPDATKIGKQFNLPIEYNALADKDSWHDMSVFFDRLFKKKP